jgi:hypothetical protein
MTTEAKRDRSTLLDQARAYIEQINLGGRFAKVTEVPVIFARSSRPGREGVGDREI